jgi:hypothetical protein
MAALAAAIGAKLRERGTAELAAGLAGQAAVAVFQVAFLRWVEAEEAGDFLAGVREAFGEMRAVTAGSAAAAAADTAPAR